MKPEEFSSLKDGAKVFWMIDVNATAALIPCSSRHVRRMADAGTMPPPVHVGRLIRWRLRTGDPTTGILDWIEAGCPRVRPLSKNS